MYLALTLTAAGFLSEVGCLVRGITRFLFGEHEEEMLTLRKSQDAIAIEIWTQVLVPSHTLIDLGYWVLMDMSNASRTLDKRQPLRIYTIRRTNPVICRYTVKYL